MITWETSDLIWVPGRALGRFLTLSTKEEESMMGWVLEKSLFILRASLQTERVDLFFRKLLKAAIDGALYHSMCVKTCEKTELQLVVENSSQIK